MIGVLHGMAVGRFSVQINARDRGGEAVRNLLAELLLGGKTPTHVARRALEQQAGYAQAERLGWSSVELERSGKGRICKDFKAFQSVLRILEAFSCVLALI